MKKKLLVLIPAVLLLLAFVCLTLFCVSRSIYAAQVTDGYFTVYRDRALDYAKASPELLAKYGDYTVRPDGGVSYRDAVEREGLAWMVSYVFDPWIPADIEEFNSRIEMMRFTLRVEGDRYTVTFEKNAEGEFFIAEMTLAED